MLSNFFHWSARWTLFFLVVLVGFFAWKWATDTLRVGAELLPAVALWVLIPTFAGGIFCGALMTLMVVPSRRDAARSADRLWNSRDRFVTALDLLERKSRTDFESMALAECGAFAAKAQRLAPVPAPAELRWAVVPVVMIALLVWDSTRQESIRRALVDKATRETAGTVQQLESLAKQLEKKSAAEDEARKLAERLRQAAEQLRAEAKEGRDGEKAALLELSKLEQLVKEMRQQHAATPEELKTLADSLAQQEQTKEAAEEMKRGNFAEAARKLDEAAKDPETAERAEKSIERALEHLTQQKEQLSKQMEQLRDNARQASASGERQQLLQQLSQALNELQKQGKLAKGKDGKVGEKQEQPQPEQQAGGKEMTDDDLKKMLGALQNLKNNEGPADGDAEGQPQPGADEQGEGQIHISNFGGKKPGSPQPGTEEKGEQFPTGQPGDKDENGTTKDPFGQQQQTVAAESGKESQAKGQLGTGESLSSMAPSASAADEKTKRRYRELYQAASADAEAAVLQETIPLGSRFLIKRYFESIRPSDR